MEGEPGRFRALLGRASERLIPIEVTLELTERCNYRCAHCFVSAPRRRDRLGTGRVLRLLEELAEAGTLFLTLSGGEVLLRRDWLEIAAAARRLGFSLRLFSNASLIDERCADALEALSASVEVSLYSLRPEVFERVTGVPGSLERTLRGLELLRQRQVPTKLKVPLTVLNRSDVGDVSTYARQIGAELRADPNIIPTRSGDPRPIHLRVPPAELADLYAAPYSPYVAPAERLGRPSGSGPVCGAGRRVAAISASGDLRACVILPVSAGSVLERPFREVWETSPWLQRLRAVSRTDLEPCGTCARLPYCARCPAQALLEGGDLLGPSPWSCEHAAALERVFARPA